MSMKTKLFACIDEYNDPEFSSPLDAPKMQVLWSLGEY